VKELEEIATGLPPAGDEVALDGAPFSVRAETPPCEAARARGAQPCTVRVALSWAEAAGDGGARPCERARRILGDDTTAIGATGSARAATIAALLDGEGRSVCRAAVDGERPARALLAVPTGTRLLRIGRAFVRLE
jgi:hypothetical protein